MIVLVVAEEAAGLQALRLVAERGHHIAGVLTGASPTGPTVAGLARQLDVPILDPGRVRDPALAEWITAQHVDLLLNVHSLRIAHSDVLAAPRIGSFNLHPGPLPRYAGLNTPSWAIYEGQTRHAVTLHWMVADVDAGAIGYEAWFDIGPQDTGLRVALNCVRHGLPLVARLLDDAARGAEHIPARPQDVDGRRWYGRAAPHGGRLPWDLPARRLADLVRAADYAPFVSPWGWPRAIYDDGREMEIVRVSATDEPAGVPPGTVGAVRPTGVAVAAADAWMVVERLRCDRRAVDPVDKISPGRRFLTDTSSC